MQANLFDMTGKVAVITGGGANGGLGHIMAVALGQDGGGIAHADIDGPGKGKSLDEIEKIGGKRIGVECGNF